jgi:hypothetical protein
MPLHIGRVEADMDITPAADTGPPPSTGAGDGPAAANNVDVAQLRPLVVQILQEELASFQRQRG